MIVPSTRVVAFIPVFGPLPRQRDGWSRASDTARQVVDLSRLAFFPTDPNMVTRFSLSLHDRPFKDLTATKNSEDSAFVRTYRRTRRLRDWQVLRVQADVELTNIVRWTHHDASGISEVSEEESIELSIGVVPSEVERLVYHLVLAANMSVPGAFEIGSGWLYQDGISSGRTNSLISDLWSANEYSEHTTWPPLTTLDVQRVWDWLVAGEHLDGSGSTPASRAVNALSHCFEAPGASNPMRLFWALMGVEALFSEDAPGVKSLVASRAQLLLGEQRSFKKDFSELYQTRSGFVHGGLAFPSAFESDATSGFRERVHKAQAVALAVLVASLQAMVQRNWHKLSFQTSIRGS